MYHSERNIEYLPPSDPRIGNNNHAYYVRIARNGVETSKMFRFDDYRSPKEALSCARSFLRITRKALDREHGAYLGNRRTVKQQSPTSTGVVGVGKSFTNTVLASGVKQAELRYSASLIIDGTPKTKGFYVGTVEQVSHIYKTATVEMELKAFRLAIFVRELYNLYLTYEIRFPYENLSTKNWREQSYEETVNQINQSIDSSVILT